MIPTAKAADSPKIKIVKERVIDPKLKEKFGEEKAKRLSGETVNVIELIGSDGKVKRRLKISGETKSVTDSVTEHDDAKVSGNGSIVVAEKKWDRQKERNPYKIRREKSIEVSWYDESGKKMGTFKGNATVRKIAENGSVTVLIDEGFDTTAFDGYHDVPGLETTESLKTDPELLDHFVYAVRPTGEVVIGRRVPGPGAAPHSVSISPDGKWFVYSKEVNVVYLNDVASGTERRIDTGLSIRWEVSNTRELSGWKLEKDDSGWEKVSGRWVAKAGRRVFRKHIIRPGESQPEKTDETRVFVLRGIDPSFDERAGQAIGVGDKSILAKKELPL